MPAQEALFNVYRQVGNLSNINIIEIRSHLSPPKNVGLIMAAVMTCLGE